MARSVPPHTLLAITSIVLAVCLWPILCYSFVVNSMKLMVAALTLSTNYSKSDTVPVWNGHHESNNPDANFGGITELTSVAMSITIYSGLIICEGVLVVCLVIQFMSSFDYLTGEGQEYEDNWWKCHRKVFLLNGVILLVKLCICLTSTQSSASYDSLFELYAIATNFVFLIIAIMVFLERRNKLGLVLTSPSPSEFIDVNVDLRNSLRDTKEPYKDSKDIKLDFNNILNTNSKLVQ